MQLRQDMVLQHKLEADLVIRLVCEHEPTSEDDDCWWSCEIVKGKTLFSKEYRRYNQTVRVLIPMKKRKLIRWFRELKMGKELFS